MLAILIVPETIFDFEDVFFTPITWFRTIFTSVDPEITVTDPSISPDEAFGIPSRSQRAVTIMLPSNSFPSSITFSCPSLNAKGNLIKLCFLAAKGGPPLTPSGLAIRNSVPCSGTLDAMDSANSTVPEIDRFGSLDFDLASICCLTCGDIGCSFNSPSQEIIIIKKLKISTTIANCFKNILR